MKIFGFYIFEDSPEVNKYKEQLAERERLQNIKDCKNDDWLPDLELSFTVGGSEENERLKDHKELAKKGKCHFFNRKKYCYHTGKEIVTKQIER